MQRLSGTLLFLIVAFCGSACGQPAGTVSGGSAAAPVGSLAVRRDYVEKLEEVPNPERGFYAAYAGGNVTDRPLVSYDVDLAAACNVSDLPAAQLAQVGNDLTLMRQQGNKAVVRFSYSAAGELNVCGFYDAASLDIVTHHISQLGAVLVQNKDAVAFIEMGFLGRWGNWSENGPDQDANAPNLAGDPNSQAAVVAALMQAMPSDRPLLLPLPGQRSAVTAPADLPRVGYYDDCFLADPTDDGTFADGGRASVEAQMASDTLKVPMGGATCEPDPNSTTNRFACLDAVAEMQALHTTYLAEAMDPNLATEWQTMVSPCYDFIEQKLGYRYIVQSVSYTAGPARGGDSITVQVAIENTGFAPIYNERHARVVLVNSAGDPQSPNIVTSQNDDLRTWLPGQTVTFTQTLQLPQKLPAGEYTYGLALPDASGNILYAVQLASSTLDDAPTFDASHGVNLLYVNLRVQ